MEDMRDKRKVDGTDMRDKRKVDGTNSWFFRSLRVTYEKC